MTEAVPRADVRRGGLRHGRRKAQERIALAAGQYAALGWPVFPGAQLRASGAMAGRACSCDRVGCPAPGAHPLSPAWKLQASADLAIVGHWWTTIPQASVLLATGRAFDVLDVPRRAGLVALDRLSQSGVSPGPVALSADDRALFFVATRAAAAEDDEWWSCHLDCEPEAVPAVAGLRWHCRDSYVLAPPSRLANGLDARWVIEPGAAGTGGADTLPDALRLLEILADACEEIRLWLKSRRPRRSGSSGPARCCLAGSTRRSGRSAPSAARRCSWPAGRGPTSPTPAAPGT